MAAKPKHPSYDVHPTVDYARAVIANMPDKTGRSIKQWVKLLKADGPRETRERRAGLKSEHGLGMTTGYMIVDWAEDSGKVDLDPKSHLAAAPGRVDELYSGPREALRPIHDAVVAGARKRHRELRISPCTTIVPLYRQHVIAQLRPATQKRVDLGLALKRATGRLPKRLIDTGGLAKGDRITHRIPLEDPDQIDDLLWKWFEVAWELDA